MAGADHEPRRIGDRYVLYGIIAAGGMATVHWGRLQGPVGFSRTVAVKRLHAQFATDPEFVAMFLDEARLAARIQHPNVVSSLDVVATDDEIFLVMEYVHGESLSRLLKSGPKGARVALPPRLAASIATGALFGLHAAHEAVDEQGRPLQIVHRDMSPQNVMVGVDGVSRVLDFGVAKAAGNSSHTRDGNLKGKLAYMSPEQLRAAGVDRRTDVYAASIVLWEMLTGHRLIEGEDDVTLLARALEGNIPWPSTLIQGIPPALEAVVMKGLSRDPQQRYWSARDMALAIEQTVPLSSQREVGEWVQSVASIRLQERAARIAAVEAHGDSRSLDASSVAAAMRARSSNDLRSAANIPPPPPSMPSLHTDVRSASHLTSMSSASSLMAPQEPAINKVLVGIGAAAVAIILMGGGALAMSHLTPAPAPVAAAVPLAVPSVSASSVTAPAPSSTIPRTVPLDDHPPASDGAPPGGTGTAAVGGTATVAVVGAKRVPGPLPGPLPKGGKPAKGEPTVAGAPPGGTAATPPTTTPVATAPPPGKKDSGNDLTNLDRK